MHQREPLRCMVGLKTCNMVNIEIKNSVIDGLMKQREKLIAHLNEMNYNEGSVHDKKMTLENQIFTIDSQILLLLEPPKKD